MTDIIIQGIYGRMGCALVEKIGAREDCRIIAYALYRTIILYFNPVS